MSINEASSSSSYRQGLSTIVSLANNCYTLEESIRPLAQRQVILEQVLR